MSHLQKLHVKFQFQHAEKFSTIIGLVKQYGEFVRVWIGPSSLLFLASDVKDVEVINAINRFINPNISDSNQLNNKRNARTNAKRRSN